MGKKLHEELMELEDDDSDHSSMYDECISSDEYQYDSDEYDEFIAMSDEEIIDKLCPFKFLNIYAHNWEGYRLLDLHMNDVWDFIEECRMKNMAIKKEWNENKNQAKPPKVSCLVFCSKQNIPISRLNAEIQGDPNYTLEAVGRSICTISETYKNQQSAQEEIVWNQQVQKYQLYMDAINDMEQRKKSRANLLKPHHSISNSANSISSDPESKENGPSMDNSAINTDDLGPILSRSEIKQQLINKEKYNQNKHAKRYEYKYWDLPDSAFWEDFETLKTRNDPLNRFFASSCDRSAALVLGFMIHSGIRLKQSYKALLKNRPNILRNQSFIRQLIQLDWMKHCFEKPGMRKQIPFRDEYESIDLETYLKTKKHYHLK